MQSGGRSIDAATTIERMPLYVRAGSILPLGPDIEYAAEKSADPIELRVYCGADGAFTLYEDENDSYDYEKGIYSTIPFSWNDAAQTLTIGDRKGSFPGMLENRMFRVVFVHENHGSGAGLTPSADKTVQYSGKKITVTP
jgi:alpha-D-xyloside xylohydrolase